MKKFLLIISILSLIHIITTKSTESKTLSETIKELEGHLLYYYINENRAKVTSILQEIQSLDEPTYQRDQEIIDYWEYIDDYMPLYPRIAPDGLPSTSDHAFVVLGYQLNSDGSLKPEAIGRCDVAYESAMKYPNALIFVTGGGTASGNKTATEGGQMKEYLVNVKGLDENRIITETKAMDTIQNAEYTILELIEKNIKTITVITSDYHIRRGNILFKGEALLKAESLGIAPIQVIENAVYETGKPTEGKWFEGYALASILDVKISLNLFGLMIKSLPNIISDLVKNFLVSYL